MERYRIPIEGMTCTSCVARITKALRRLDGVASVHVDLADDVATVAFDPARSSLRVLAEAIARAGYAARIEGAWPVTDLERPGLLARLRLRR